MIPSPADAWLNAGAGEQGSTTKQGALLLPPRFNNKPRHSSSPASSVDRDAAPSIGRSGVKGGRTPLDQAPRSHGKHGLNSSGCKFSFGKCMLSRGKNSPMSFMRGGLQPGGGGAATPNLVLGTKPCGQLAGGAAQHAEQAETRDTVQSKDSCKAPAHGHSASQDLDLQQHTSPEAVDAAIKALSEPQRQSVQRLLCSPAVLASSKESLTSLSQCPNLSFLILSLNECHQQQQQAPPSGQTSGAPVVDLWPGLQHLMASLPRVVCLDVSNCLMQDTHLQVIAGSCPKLRALDVSYSPHITADGLGKLLVSCSNLEELDISTCPAAISDSLLRTLAQSCHNLSSLYVELDTAANSSDAEACSCQVSCEAVTAVAAGCKQLQVLSLAGLPVTASPSAPASASLPSFAAACPQLVSLDVSGCTWPRPEDWRALGSSATAALPSLQTLSVSAGLAFDDATLRSVAAACSGLVSLSVQDDNLLTDAGWQAAVAMLPHLTELTLSSRLASGQDQENVPPSRAALAEALAARGVCLVQLPRADRELDGEASGLDMDMDVAASPAPRGHSQDGREGSGPDPMSVARSEAKGTSHEARQAHAEAGAAEVGASWSSVMSFLTNHVTDVQMASCQKAARPRH